MARPARTALDHRLVPLETALARVRMGPAADAIQRLLSDLGALRFHLTESTPVPIVALIGGTGTGKSTLTNRLVGRDITIASFRRTFTAGPVAVVPSPNPLPPTYLRLEHRLTPLDQTPVRGQPHLLTIVEVERQTIASILSSQSSIAGKISPEIPALIDTPDLDGDHPDHHALADRVFRWAQAAVFVVTPEKYQMPELLPYYRLARRYAIPAVFVMNKCEHDDVLQDYRKQLASREWPDALLYAVERTDAGWSAPPDQNFDSLKSSLGTFSLPPDEDRQRGLRHRTADLADRLVDQVVAPLRRRRSEVDELINALHTMESPPPGVDVSPITLQLQRRLQQRSVLYLIGPQRVLDRARQIPSLLARLPRTTWELFRGHPVAWPSTPPGTPLPIRADSSDETVPDFPLAVEEQFRILQTKVDDLLRSNPSTADLLASEDDLSSYQSTLLDPILAAAIAQQEIDALREWLEARWNANPRDTRLLMSMLRRLPGARKLSEWSEAAPYLLAILLATHHAFFGHTDLMVLGGYSLTTWLTERLSNEVASQARITNRRISDRFIELAHEQLDRIASWLDTRTPSPEVVAELERLTESLAAEDPPRK